jgi:uncharacterized membrane protein
MNKNRLEAFSDGVIAIILTIMVLELKIPHGSAFSDLAAVCPVVLSYILSFVYVGIYWNNHHHLFQAAHQINGQVMWANLHLLFWLSLTPFVTGWAGENHFAQAPVALYGVVLMFSGFAYYLLSRALITLHGKDSLLSRAVGDDRKGKLSVIFYAAAIALSFWEPLVACLIYVMVAIMWIIPDRRIESAL